MAGILNSERYQAMAREGVLDQWSESLPYYDFRKDVEPDTWDHALATGRNLVSPLNAPSNVVGLLQGLRDLPSDWADFQDYLTAYSSDMGAGAAGALAEDHPDKMAVGLTTAPILGAGVGVAGMLPKGQAVGSFGGRLAKTADQAKLLRAKELAEAGSDRQKIWDETGWFQGADGDWRFEIDDSGSRIKAPSNKKYGLFGTRKYDVETTGELLDHPALFDAYPEIADVPLIQPEYGYGANAGYRRPPDAESPATTLAERYAQEEFMLFDKARKNDKAARLGLLHEMQHKIQDHEGFATGGAIEEAIYGKYGYIDKDYTSAIDNLIRLGPQKALSRFERLDKPREASLLKRGLAESDGTADGVHRWLLARSEDDINHPVNQYLHMAGETEARNVQSRRDMTPEERRAKPPWETQDYPDNEQIVRRLKDDPFLKKNDGSTLFANAPKAAVPGVILAAPEEQDALNELMRQ